MTENHETTLAELLNRPGYCLEVDGGMAAVDFTGDGYLREVRRLGRQVELSKRAPEPLGIPYGQLQLRHYSEDTVVHGPDFRLTQTALETVP